jgi:hypothetical protein
MDGEASMTDRELLELAAKAAGYHWPLTWPNPSPVDVPHDWNPLTSPADALALAVKLNLCVDIGDLPGRVLVEDTIGKAEAVEWFANTDPLAATCRAITRAAAEIGKGMK